MRRIAAKMDCGVLEADSGYLYLRTGSRTVLSLAPESHMYYCTLFTLSIHTRILLYFLSLPVSLTLIPFGYLVRVKYCARCRIVLGIHTIS